MGTAGTHADLLCVASTRTGSGTGPELQSGIGDNYMNFLPATVVDGDETPPRGISSVNMVGENSARGQALAENISVYRCDRILAAPKVPVFHLAPWLCARRKLASLISVHCLSSVFVLFRWGSAASCGRAANELGSTANSRLLSAFKACDLRGPLR